MAHGGEVSLASGETLAVFGEIGGRGAVVNITEVINTLTPEEQESVMQFIQFLKKRESTSSPFVRAADEFMEQHPELLRRLAQ
jgi:hypothetical protein